MPYHVVNERFEAMPVLVLRKTVGCEDLVPTLLDAMGQVWNRVRAEGVQGAGRNVAVYRGGPDGAIDFEAGVELLQGHNMADSELGWSPGGECVHTVHVGDYGKLSEAHEAVLEWCRENGLKPAGPNMEIYGHWTDDPADLTTDVFYFIEPELRPGP